MIKHITEFFSAHISLTSDTAQQDSVHPIQLAIAALLIEVSRSDFTIDEIERNSVTDLLKTQFELSAEDLDTLIELGQQEAEQAVSLYPFTRLINDNYSSEQKSQLILNLWKVALADGYIDKHEDHLIRKVADLIHVSHKEFIRTKLVARDSANGRDRI